MLYGPVWLCSSWLSLTHFSVVLYSSSTYSQCCRVLSSFQTWCELCVGVGCCHGGPCPGRLRCWQWRSCMAAYFTSATSNSFLSSFIFSLAFQAPLIFSLWTTLVWSCPSLACRVKSSPTSRRTPFAITRPTRASRVQSVFGRGQDIQITSVRGCTETDGTLYFCCPHWSVTLYCDRIGHLGWRSSNVAIIIHFVLQVMAWPFGCQIVSRGMIQSPSRHYLLLAGSLNLKPDLFCILAQVLRVAYCF